MSTELSSNVSSQSARTVAKTTPSSPRAGTHLRLHKVLRAEPIRATSVQTREYVVKKGDFLERIAIEQLGTVAGVGQILILNPHIVTRPDLIYVNEVLRLPAIMDGASGTSEIEASTPIPQASSDPDRQEPNAQQDGKAAKPVNTSSQTLVFVPPGPQKAKYKQPIKEIVFGPVCTGPGFATSIVVKGELEFGDESAPIEATISVEAPSVEAERRLYEDSGRSISTTSTADKESISGGLKVATDEEHSYELALRANPDGTVDLTLRAQSGPLSLEADLLSGRVELETGAVIPLSKWCRLNTNVTITSEENPVCRPSTDDGDPPTTAPAPIWVIVGVGVIVGVAAIVVVGSGAPVLVGLGTIVVRLLPLLGSFLSRPAIRTLPMAGY